MKYKLIAGAIASVLTIGGLSVLPFKEVNIDPQIESINHSTTIVSKAKDIIEKLGNNVTELSNRNKELVIENENLKEEINNESGNSEMDYKNPSNNPNEVLGTAIGKRFELLISYSDRTSGKFRSTVGYYSYIKCSERFINFYKYMINNDIYYDSDKSMENIKEQANGLYDLNDSLYGSKVGYKKFYSFLEQSFEEIKSNTARLPQSEVEILENMSLSPNLEKKFNEFFDVYIIYCKNNNITSQNNYDLKRLLQTYKELLECKYLKEYYSYLNNHQELLSSNTIKIQCKKYADQETKKYQSKYNDFDKKLDELIKKYK